MKKLISLIASLSLAATMVAPAFAADANAQTPVVESTVVEYSASDFEAATGIALTGNQKGFLVTANVTGLDLESKAGTGFNAAKRSGVMLTTIQYTIELDDPSKLVSVIAMDDGACPAGTEGIICGTSKNSAVDAFPTGVENGDTTGKTMKEIYLNTFAIVTDGAVDATVAAEFLVVPFTNNTAGTQAVYRNDKGNVSYKVNGETTSTINFGAPIPVQDIIVANKMTLPSGLSWDVTINNYAPAKTYTATFTATGEADKVHDLNFSAVAEATEGASFGFAALLKLKTEKTNVELAVTKN